MIETFPKVKKRKKKIETTNVEINGSALRLSEETGASGDKAVEGSVEPF